MSGREKVVTFQYDTDGRFIQKWNSLASVREEYYPESEYIGKYPLFRYNSQYHILPDGTMLTKERFGRKLVVKTFARDANPLIYTEEDVKPINILNMDGEVVASFINLKIASIITNISYRRLYGYLNKKPGKSLPSNDLRILVEYAK